MSDSTTRSFTLPASVPIPVGHRVELRFFLRSDQGWRPTLVPNTTQPLVTDLDTGIRYGFHWHFGPDGGFKGNAEPPEAYPFEPRADLEPVEIVTGRVTACRVLIQVFNAIQHVQTTLVVQA